MGLAQVTLGIASMVGDCGVEFVTGCGEIRHQAAETEAHHTDLAAGSLDLPRGAYRRDDIPHTAVTIVGGIEGEALFHSSSDQRVEIDAALLPPEQFGAIPDKSGSRQFAAGLTDVVVDAKTSWRPRLAGAGVLAGLAT